jgi:hypothetical protein
MSVDVPKTQAEQIDQLLDSIEEIIKKSKKNGFIQSSNALSLINLYTTIDKNHASGFSKEQKLRLCQLDEELSLPLFVMDDKNTLNTNLNSMLIRSRMSAKDVLANFH